MNCSCDYERPEFFRQSTPVARKEHHCGECSRIITVGERYHYIAGKWEGDFNTHFRCSHCEKVASTMREAIPCYCDYYGGLWETIGDGWLDDLRSAETGDYFRVMRLIVEANHMAKGK